MRTQQAVSNPRRSNLVLAMLFAAMFVLGSAELLLVGVLNLVAADLRVSIPAAGRLVTAYALGLAIGGPILAALTTRLNKRTVMAGALVLFIVANVVLVLTNSYSVFLVVRTLAGAVQGLFIAAAFTVVAIAAAWATSFLQPPAVETAADTATDETATDEAGVLPVAA